MRFFFSEGYIFLSKSYLCFVSFGLSATTLYIKANEFLQSDITNDWRRLTISACQRLIRHFNLYFPEIGFPARYVHTS